MSDFQVLIKAKLDKGSIDSEIKAITKEKKIKLEVELGDSFSKLPSTIDT